MRRLAFVKASPARFSAFSYQYEKKFFILNLFLLHFC
ncbi:hypothetical protein B23_0317 [Geobacillus thermoleovorans B23]|nr:hypothetical protein B23_0317 [Geobacillus thermoleovorans B23]